MGAEVPQGDQLTLIPVGNNPAGVGAGEHRTSEARVLFKKKKKSKNEPPTTKMSHFNSILLTETGT